MDNRKPPESIEDEKLNMVAGGMTEEEEVKERGGIPICPNCRTNSFVCREDQSFIHYHEPGNWYCVNCGTFFS